MTTTPDVEEFMERARKMREQLGRVPGLAVLKKEMAIGEPKAKEIRRRLNEEDGSPKTSLPEAPVSPGMGPVRDLPIPTLPVEPSLEEVPEDSTEKAPWETSFDGEPPWEAAFVEDVEEVPAAPAGAIPSPAPQPVPTPSPVTPVAASPKAKKDIAVWPILIVLLPAFVAIWGGWVDLGVMSGFGVVDMLPGLTNDNGDPLLKINLSITLPVGLEAYASYAIYVWLGLDKGHPVRKFAGISAIASLAVGGLGQVVYHLLKAAEYVKAPWPVVIFVAVIPVAVGGMGVFLAHGVRHGRGA